MNDTPESERSLARVNQLQQLRPWLDRFNGLLLKELESALDLHPGPFKPFELVAALAEETGEYAQANFKGEPADCQKEIIQVATVALRIWLDMFAPQLASNSNQRAFDFMPAVETTTRLDVPLSNDRHTIRCGCLDCEKERLSKNMPGSKIW